MKFMKIAFFVLLGLVVLAAMVFGPRLSKDIKKKRAYENTYAIQNVATDKCLRPYNAENDDGTKIIQYSLNNWECLTWQLIGLENDTYFLKNLYTQKSFQPSSVPVAGVTLWQQTMGGTSLQHWEFIKQANETYLIRLKDTELYLTAISNENDSDIVLMPQQDSAMQLWRLVRQNPIV
ncbi:RICIN domain-containing protein [Bacteroides thetaiotaomicron]|jgi:ricin-type beta-trefoil lectin domain|uniref:RICIN domain-containing protein n=1 Tax=Bacteroides thetaiotaomicron TaxID=818 RepID=UPI0018A0463F|nr:RICIN domain-containing protein [Bacteroides thetaiotaomicron]MDC2187836.1 RICIN domain-containing protein [Bacteroides thetaiotaomicron]